MNKFTLGFVLLLAFAHGLIYIFLVPPWQHYDEPSHFEHVWFLAVKGEIPDEKPVDLEFRRKLVQSMIANNFFDGQLVPDPSTLEVETQIFGLTYSQFDEPPLYYFLASLPVRFFQERNPAIQLISARLMSLGLFLLTVIAIRGMTVEITSPNSSLRLWVPLMAALLPGLVDLMTAVNNDVGAITAFSLFLWASLRFLNKPVSAFTIFGVIGSAILCAGMKSSAFVALPLAFVLFVFKLVQGPKQTWLWAGVFLVSLVGVLSLMTWDDAAHWHRGTSQLLPTRVRTDQAPLGDFALQIEPGAPTTPDWLPPLQQPLKPSQRDFLTLGVWLWVSEAAVVPVELRTPIINTENAAFFETVTVDTEPKFFAFVTPLPLESARLWLTLSPESQVAEGRVYYDGFVLVEGRYPLDEAPIFDDPTGNTGTWGGRRFQNLVQNPSAEAVWPALRPAIDNRLSRIIPDRGRVSIWLYGLFDWQHTGWYFRATAQNLMETFWGRFGWGHVPLTPLGWYTILGLLSGVGSVGFGLFLLSRWQAWNKTLLFLALVMGAIWGATILRGEMYLFTSRVFIPGARYAYPAIGPTLIMLMAGWLACGRLVKQLPPFRFLASRFAPIIGALFFLALDVASFTSIWFYYAR